MPSYIPHLRSYLVCTVHVFFAFLSTRLICTSVIILLVNIVSGYELFIFGIIIYRFSGLSADDFIGIETTLEDVQQELLRMFYSDTILLGHSLESDLRAMKVKISM